VNVLLVFLPEKTKPLFTLASDDADILTQVTQLGYVSRKNFRSVSLLKSDTIQTGKSLPNFKT